MARSKKSQSKHDAKVREIAGKLKKQGFDVRADILGYPKPGTIHGVRPDVLAIKGKRKKIIEVETPDSAGTARDQKQQQAFREAARRSGNTTFIRKLADK